MPRHLRTQGQAGAVAAITAMLRGHVPHALLLVGPSGAGKTTLAEDVAAALLCRAVDPSDRPDGTCRACRAVAHGNHPDLHRLAPTGPGGVIPIGGRDERGLRDLVAELAFLPVEGGARVAIVEAASRMTEDAQTAFLKTLEEPPAGAVLILCADDEERLLPTIRSRCVRLRLGPVPRRDVEAILVERGLADAVTAARVARLAHGRPGLALAYAAAPEAVVVRAEIARSLLDLSGAARTARLIAVRDLAARAGALQRALDAGSMRSASGDAASVPAEQRDSGTRRTRARGAATAEPAPEPMAGAAAGEDAAEPGESRVRVPAAERRAAALALVGVWREVLRDLAAAAAGEPRLIRATDLIDDLQGAASRTTVAEIGSALRRLDVAGERLEGNVSPELVLDVLALQAVG